MSFSRPPLLTHWSSRSHVNNAWSSFRSMETTPQNGDATRAPVKSPALNVNEMKVTRSQNGQTYQAGELPECSQCWYVWDCMSNVHVFHNPNQLVRLRSRSCPIGPIVQRSGEINHLLSPFASRWESLHLSPGFLRKGACPAWVGGKWSSHMSGKGPTIETIWKLSISICVLVSGWNMVKHHVSTTSGVSDFTSFMRWPMAPMAPHGPHGTPWGQRSGPAPDGCGAGSTGGDRPWGGGAKGGLCSFGQPDLEYISYVYIELYRYTNICINYIDIQTYVSYTCIYLYIHIYIYTIFGYVWIPTLPRCQCTW